jgi:hypothetical protein
MQPNLSYRPRVSRETRLLLTAGVAAVTVLWLLARVRFDDRPVTPNPVPSVLGQLNSGARYDTLASEIADLQSRLAPWLVVVDDQIAAFRWRDDLAIALVPGEGRLERRRPANTQALDPGTGLAVIRVSDRAPASLPPQWTPRDPRQPRYVAGTDAVSSALSLRPAFVGSFARAESPVWPGALWMIPAGSAVAPGSFLFTTSAEFVGLVIQTEAGPAIVPGGTVLSEAERLVSAPELHPGTIDVEVQPLTEPIASLTGTDKGVVVTWVDRGGPSWGTLMVGDVIDGVGGRDLVNVQQWNVRMSRVTAGETVTLRVRRRNEVHDASVQAKAVEPAEGSPALGLTLRRRAGAGAEVTRVEPGTAAERAGLTVGDVITVFNGLTAPTPAQITRSFADLAAGDRVLVAVTRGNRHVVTALGR